MQMLKMQVLMVICAIILIFAFVIVMKAMGEFEEDNDPVCLALFFPAFIIGLLFMCNIVYLIGTLV